MRPQSIRYSTIEIKEAARIGYTNVTGFLFRMSTQVKAEVLEATFTIALLEVLLYQARTN